MGPGREGDREERLRLPFVADARDERLVEQSLAELASSVGRPEPLQHLRRRGRRDHDVGPEAREPPRSKLEHWPISLHGLPVAPAQHEPWPSEHRPTDRLNEPAAVHPQVAPHGEAALERENEVLPACFYPLEPLP